MYHNLEYHIPNVMLARPRAWLCASCLKASRDDVSNATQEMLEREERARVAESTRRSLHIFSKTYRYGRISPDLSAGKRRSLNRSVVLRWLGRKCQLCGCIENLEVHHVRTVRIGGTNDLRNLAVLCRTCHREQVHRNGTRAPPQPLAS